ncbi:MAG: hypothetical protein QMC81_10165 [Thermoanaerobacterales bacterium]|nr:hypothetical protein [Bacillota bacterium]MDI6907830.1 hypothetical protein [Thermoanaerobacterales bacterium]
MAAKRDSLDPGALAAEHFDVDFDRRAEETGDRPDTPPSAYVDPAVSGEPPGSVRAQRMARQAGRSLTE